MTPDYVKWHWWFWPWWWKYLLRGCTGWRHFRCRVQGHPAGPDWFTTEDHLKCRNCGEDLA